MYLHLAAGYNLQFSQVHTKEFQWLSPRPPFPSPIIGVYLSLLIHNKQIKTFLFKTKNHPKPQNSRFFAAAKTNI